MIFLLFSVSGCAGDGAFEGMSAAEDFEGRCALSAKRTPDSRIPLSDSRPDTEDSLPSGLSPEAVEIARTIRVLPLLRIIAVLEAGHPERDAAAQFRLLGVRQQLANEIQSALFELQSTAAEVRCEKERADQLADRLQESLNREVKLLTVTAILTGAVFGFASGGLFLAGVSTAGTAVGLSGGLVETILGTVALNEDRRAELRHTRNILRDVWEGSGEATIIPDTVWRFLNQPMKEEPRRRSLRDTLVLRWRQDGRLGTAGSVSERHRIPLLFGPGGEYGIADLRARAAMLDLLEADITLMTQDLNLLLEEALVDPARYGPQ